MARVRIPFTDRSFAMFGSEKIEKMRMAASDVSYSSIAMSVAVTMLKEEISEILKLNPELSERHYLSYTMKNLEEELGRLNRAVINFQQESKGYIP